MSKVLSRFENDVPMTHGGMMTQSGSMSLVNFGLALSQIGGGLSREDISSLLDEGSRGRGRKGKAPLVSNGQVLQWGRLVPELVGKLLEADERRWRISMPGSHRMITRVQQTCACRRQTVRGQPPSSPFLHCNGSVRSSC